VDSKNDLIISWNKWYVSFNKLSPVSDPDLRHPVVSQYKDLTDEDEKILDVIVLCEYRYFITATSEGNIFVWKYVIDEKLQTTRRLIHTFAGHFKAVSCLQLLKGSPHLIVSVSVDSTARIWSIDTF
jgi:WD40 repeat protein